MAYHNNIDTAVFFMSLYYFNNMLLVLHYFLIPFLNSPFHFLILRNKRSFGKRSFGKRSFGKRSFGKRSLYTKPKNRLLLYKRLLYKPNFGNQFLTFPRNFNFNLPSNSPVQKHAPILRKLPKYKPIRGKSFKC